MGAGSSEFDLSWCIGGDRKKEEEAQIKKQITEVTKDTNGKPPRELNENQSHNNNNNNNLPPLPASRSTTNPTQLPPIQKRKTDERHSFPPEAYQ